MSFKILLPICLAICALGCQPSTKPGSSNATHTELSQVSMANEEGRSPVERNRDVQGEPLEYDLTKIERTEQEWKDLLTDEQFQVTRKHGTERAFTGELWDNKDDGVYHCVGCDLPLFESGTKFKSGTGWPSFYQPLKADHVGETSDVSFFMRRTEVHCNRCDSHLGHVFEDGPRPTGLRYCINSASLTFKDADDLDAGVEAKEDVDSDQ